MPDDATPTPEELLAQKRERQRLAQERHRRRKGIPARPRQHLLRMTPEERHAYDLHMGRIRNERYDRKRGVKPPTRMTLEQRRQARQETLLRYRANRPDRIKANRRRFLSAHPESQQTYVRRRRARLAGIEINDLSGAQWREIQETQRHRCYYCGRRYLDRSQCSS